MDLYAGLPFWLIKNELYDYFNSLEKDYEIDVAIIGSGITGSLVAHELCEAGVHCAIFDKRIVSNGSTVASTAQLQYEIDVPLHKMIQDIGEDRAVKAYKASLQSITAIENLFKTTGIKGDFKRVSTCYLASNHQGLRSIKKEYEARSTHQLPVSYLDADRLEKEYHIKGLGALYNDTSAQIDTYKSAIGILKYHQKKHQLPIFSPVEIIEYKEQDNGYILLTKDGFKIKCKYVIVAAGFEAGQFLPKQVMELNSTYALVSKPIRPEQFWKERSLIWETAEPYFYMRTTSDNRIMMGGEDEEFRNPDKRDRLLKTKVSKLLKKFAKLYPAIAIEVDMAWCGTFSSTKDGLPFIGAWPGKKNMLYALGYGGNGITFSMIAAQVIRNIITGEKDDRIEVFGFERLKK
ncbi:FAD-binding oxidoreductase [Sphingobacterium sp. SRCM116780]|uniref:NAD(P)/FAD-dependent oxidoreductase n=1 Tax=Sphingobacterium sp. SRCM116780 TaxID=2907623 RepID=UPI001F3208C7|nr:FAD-dependent oxidoreductase [Sphingobacterium sp. SRCM116780]UIR57628.1 FAD-binding oxidoreductase [Sphingobacterium sp. SRCM116780]